MIIGRNEGERLLRCLASVRGAAEMVVYVDSGSTDGSLQEAQEAGVTAVSLDPTTPFTAARGRNRGFELLEEARPDLELVQFVDGDTEIAPGWIDRASGFLREHPTVALVCGNLRERWPTLNAYHRLAEMEWHASPGEIRTAGGNVMARAAAFREVGGYDVSMAAGEDPELCVRLRRAGYGIFRLDVEMGIHDADMHRFGQWWRRAVRDGQAYVEIVLRQGDSPEPYWLRRLGSIVVWGGVLPLAALSLAWPTSGLAPVGLLGAYAVLWGRTYRGSRREGTRPGDAALFASHCVMGKLAGFVGMLRSVWGRVTPRRAPH